MPLYEYKCIGCGNIIEKLVDNASEFSIVRCDKCGRKATKIISRPGPVWKFLDTKTKK